MPEKTLPQILYAGNPETAVFENERQLLQDYLFSDILVENTRRH